jgi:hypothetical protein
LLCKRSDRNIAANTRTVSRARPLWVLSVRQDPNLVAPGIPLFFIAGLKIFLARYLNRLGNAPKVVIELGTSVAAKRPLDTMPWSTGMRDAILSLARLFPVFHDKVPRKVNPGSNGGEKLNRYMRPHPRCCVRVLLGKDRDLLRHEPPYLHQILKRWLSVKCYKYFTVLSRTSYKVGAGSHLRELGPDLNPHPPTPQRGWGRNLNSLPVANCRDRLTDTRCGHAYASVLCASSIPSTRGRAARYFYRDTNAATPI